MDCKEVDRLLPYYITDELDEEVAIEMDLHTRYCPHCQELYLQEQEVRKVLQSLRHEVVDTPGHLRAGIMEGLDEIDRQNRPSLWTLPSFRLAASMATSVAVALFAIFMWAGNQQSLDPSQGLMSDAISRHARLLPLEVKTPDVQKIRTWFDGKVDFALPDIPLKPLSAQVVGARLSNVRDHQAAQVSLATQDGRRYTLLVYEYPKKISAQAVPRKVGDMTFYLAHQRGYNMVMWKKRDIMYTLIGQDSTDRMIDMVSMK